MVDDKLDYQAQIFFNRLQKKNSHLKKWAKRNNIFCYRVYDRDIKEIPLAIDLYEIIDEDFFANEIFARENSGNEILQNKNSAKEICARKKSANEICARENFCKRFVLLYVYSEKSDGWMRSMKRIIAEIFSLADETRIIEKKRVHAKGGSQYANVQSANEIKGLTNECGKIFFVHLTRAIDTGLFLDARLLRCEIEKESAQKKVLNLFCYTGSFSVYAAKGGARSIDSVDLSNTYLELAKKNMKLNGFCNFEKFRFIKSDCKTFLENYSSESYDIIILDPPTFSNSKMSKTVFSILDDWKNLVSLCASHLKKNGALYFSTNAKQFRLDENFLAEKKMRAFDLTRKTASEDFKNKIAHRAWKIVFA